WKVLPLFLPRNAPARRNSASKPLIPPINRLGTSDALALVCALKAKLRGLPEERASLALARLRGQQFFHFADGRAAWRVAMPVKVHLDQVGMAFTTPGGTFRAVEPIDLEIETGRFVSLVGPSGCGKSTL